MYICNICEAPITPLHVYTHLIRHTKAQLANVIFDLVMMTNKNKKAKTRKPRKVNGKRKLNLPRNRKRPPKKNIKSDNFGEGPSGIANHGKYDETTNEMEIPTKKERFNNIPWPHLQDIEELLNISNTPGIRYENQVLPDVKEKKDDSTHIIPETANENPIMPKLEQLERDCIDNVNLEEYEKELITFFESMKSVEQCIDINPGPSRPEKSSPKIDTCRNCKSVYKIPDDLISYVGDFTLCLQCNINLRATTADNSKIFYSTELSTHPKTLVVEQSDDLTDKIVDDVLSMEEDYKMDDMENKKCLDFFKAGFELAKRCNEINMVDFYKTLLQLCSEPLEEAKNENENEKMDL